MGKADDKVKNILANIKVSKTSKADIVNIPTVDSNKNVPVKKSVSDVPRGRPKSGRIWKNTKQRFSSIIKTKAAHQTFQEKEALRQKLKETKEASKIILEQKKAQKEAQKERRRQNIKKAEENRLKSEIVQVISNPAKIKRMRKKQLRFIEKRNTTKVSK